jgi:HK97 family phage major capsid protein
MAIAAKMAEVLKDEKLTPADRKQKFEAMDAEQESIRKEVELIERQEKLDAELRGSKAPANDTVGAVGATPSKEERQKAYNTAFWDVMKNGEKRTLRQRGASEESIKVMAEYRDQEAGTQSISYTQGAGGGYTVPAGFVYDIEVATKAFAPLADGSVIRILETATGAVLPYPTNNDTNEAWSIIGEAAQVSDQGQSPNYSTQGSAPSGQPGNLTMGVVNFGAWKGTTGLVRVSLELLQDSAFDLQAFLTQAFAVRMGRGYEYLLTKGSGSSQPTGIVTAVLASGATPVIAAGSAVNDGSSNTGANSIGTPDLVNLEHSVDPTYRRGAKFMFHDNTLKVIKNLLDKYGRPIWLPGLAANSPDTVLGYPFVINQSMDQVAATKNTVMFGSLQKFIMRKVRDLSVLRLDERFADYGEVAFIAFSRIDSNLVDAGTHPINLLQMHS